jgi:hypothetical protein
MCVVGIDPGKRGYAVALNLKQKRIFLIKLKFDDLRFDPSNLLRFLDDQKIDAIYVEKVQGRGGWGATQNFNFGFVTGQIYAAINEYDYYMVTPRTWQNHIGKIKMVNPEAEPKKKTFMAYRKFYPQNPLPTNRVGNLDDNMIDALMIATFAACKTYEKKYLKFDQLKVSDQKFYNE